MTRRFDATPKFLLELGPRDWLALIGRTTTAPVTIVESDLSTVSSQADKIVRVEESRPWLAHFEPFSSRDPQAPRRMCRYSIQIEEKLELPVWTAVILLRREADGPELTGSFRRFLPDGTCYDEFRYQVIRVWELETEELLRGGIATLPLAPISNVQRDQLPDVIARMRARIETVIPATEQKDFWTATAILLGARHEKSFVEGLLKGIANMRESSVVQAFLEEGRQEGRQEGLREGIQQGLHEGLREGRCDEARGMVLRVCSAHLGEPDLRISAWLDGLTDVNAIEAFGKRALKATSWEELLPPGT